jgi:lysophospholipase L1-like esterase
MTTPNDCAYIIISIEQQYKDQFMICKSSLPSEYVPFKYILDKVNNVDEITPLRNTVNGLEPRLSSVEGRMLSAGLNIYCIGDSLTRGVDQGTHVIDKGYPYWLEALLEATAVNCGYPGATSQSWWNSYKSLYPEPDDNTDIVLIMFGSNGGLDTNTLSTDVEQYNNYADYADSGVGNMCKIIEWVMEKTHNHAQIILMTPPVNWTEGAEYRYTRVLNTVPVVKKIAGRYSLPVIDVFNESGMNRFNGSAFRPIDGLHFNAHGYQKLGTYIASQIKGLYSTFEAE